MGDAFLKCYCCAMELNAKFVGSIPVARLPCLLGAVVAEMEPGPVEWLPENSPDIGEEGVIRSAWRADGATLVQRAKDCASGDPRDGRTYDLDIELTMRGVRVSVSGSSWELIDFSGGTSTSFLISCDDLGAFHQIRAVLAREIGADRDLTELPETACENIALAAKKFDTGTCTAIVARTFALYEHVSPKPAGWPLLLRWRRRFAGELKDERLYFSGACSWPALRILFAKFAITLRGKAAVIEWRQTDSTELPDDNASPSLARSTVFEGEGAMYYELIRSAEGNPRDGYGYAIRQLLVVQPSASLETPVEICSEKGELEPELSGLWLDLRSVTPAQVALVRSICLAFDRISLVEVTV